MDYLIQSQQNVYAGSVLLRGAGLAAVHVLWVITDVGDLGGIV